MEQQKSFDQLKGALTTSPVLTLLDPEKHTVVSGNASSYSVGAVLRQCQEDGSFFKPVAYASRTLTDTERRYAQVEKEGLAVVWACERFQDFVTGLHIEIKTDHKPLVPIFMSKNLADITPRLQRMKMRMMQFSYGDETHHRKGADCS